jgi:hypothetical protein
MLLAAIILGAASLNTPAAQASTQPVHQPVEHEDDSTTLDTTAQVVESNLASVGTALVTWEHNQVHPASVYNHHSQEFLVVWQDQHWGWGQDADIYGRRVGPDGVPLSEHFGIAWEGNGRRLAPDVAYNATNGEFLVVWEYEFAADDHDIWARRIDSNGVLVGSEFAIAALDRQESSPAVAYNAVANEYLIIWQRREGSDAVSHEAIYGQRLDAGGAIMGDPFPISAGLLDQIDPAIAYSSGSNRYLVIWQEAVAPSVTQISASDTPFEFDIYGQVVDSNGALSGSQVVISTWEYDQRVPRVAYNPTADEFLVVWQDHHWGWGQDADIYGQRVTADGSLAGANFGIAWDDVYRREAPDVTYDTLAGEYMVVWEQLYSASDRDLQRRRVRGDGTLLGDEVTVTKLPSTESHPALASANQRAQLLIWEDSRTNATEGIDLYAAHVTLPPPDLRVGDNHAPTLFVDHTIDSASGAAPGAGAVSIRFHADAWDPETDVVAGSNGIVRLEIWALAFGESHPIIHAQCEPADWLPSYSCQHQENGPWNSNLLAFIYYAKAEDRSGNIATTPAKIAWLINQGSDADNDNLADAVENIICTDPQNPDSDRDNLLDGWEVEGYQFADGHGVDLPSMGAHPCIQDVFVEIDWRSPTDRPDLTYDLQPAINMYKAHGIRLHIDYGQWGGGEDIGAVAEEYKKHFDPHRLWSFHYVIFNEKKSFCWRGKIAHVGRRDRPETFMHELGHCLGLGHGGSRGPNTQMRSGTSQDQQKWGFEWVWYDQDADETNNKPNYLSMMNYAWNGLVYSPGAAGTGFVYPHHYLEKGLPTLNENSLDERASSAFVLALRSYPLPPGMPAGAVRATMYSCLDPDDGQVYILATDGHKLLGRFRHDAPWPGGWHFTGLPAQDKAGIDWDCDGKIEESVSTNINGCSGQCFLHKLQAGWQPGQPVTTWKLGEELTSVADWTRVPALDPCLGDGALGSEYLLLAHEPPCEAHGWAPNASHVHSAHELFVPPGEFCNGQDDDGNELVDENCPDLDQDGLVDELDNCPFAHNPEQADSNGDLLGDTCSSPPPPPSEVTGIQTGNTVTLAWQVVDAAGIAGYNVYRRGEQEPVFVFLGSQWPSAAGGHYFDEAPPGTQATYQVKAVNGDGLESEPVEAVWVTPTMPLYLPFVMRVNGE